MQTDGVEFGGDGAAFDSDSDSDSDDEDLDERAEQMQVRTGALDEKSSAMQALGMYAEHTGEAFLPYLERAVKTAESLTSMLLFWVCMTWNYSHLPL